MLTEPKLKAAKSKDKEYKLFDGGGLYLLIRPTGKKYWKYKYRFHGKEKKLSIGVYPEIGLKQARQIHTQAKELLAQNIDPSLYKQREKERQVHIAINTFSALTSEWLEVKKKEQAQSTAKRTEALLAKDITPYLGKRPIDEIETYELTSCLQRVVERGAIETAHKCRQIMNQVFRYAKQTGRIKHNPASDLAGAIPTQKAKHHAAITEPQAFGGLLVKIAQYEGSHIIRTALQLAPLLFQRPSELCSMEWAEIDLSKREWVIPEHKKKERNQIEGDHIIPLSQQSTTLLEDIQPLTGHGQYVFPNQRDYNKHIATDSINKALRKLGYDTKTEQCTHGFRASARTMLEEQLQLRMEWIEIQLAHKIKDPLGNAYNRAKYLPERVEMMQRWADYCDELKRQHLAGNVITASFGGIK